MITNKTQIIGDWLIFIRVVECRSFSTAARVLNRSVSAISKSVAKLENILSTQLIIRNARSFEITPAGHITYMKAKELCLSYRELVAEIEDSTRSIQGVLRLAAPTVLNDSIIPLWIRSYTKKNPEVVINLHSREGGSFSANSPEFDDLVIKSGYIDSPDLIHKKLNPVPFKMYASPSYLESHKAILHPDNLLEHKIIKLNHPSLTGPLTFRWGDCSQVQIVGYQPSFTSNNVSSIVKMITDGAGVCVAIPEWVGKPYLESGLLQEVLPEWQLPDLPSYLVWRYRTNYSLLFRDFITYIENQWNDFFCH